MQDKRILLPLLIIVAVLSSHQQQKATGQGTGPYIRGTNHGFDLHRALVYGSHHWSYIFVSHDIYKSYWLVIEKVVPLRRQVAIKSP